ncbi:MAG: bifunctional metallophosphatase/5'-nucleotidase [Deltaproteobacteria bacterium]|nr:bifunctional metallophosphatase/5'-nucleotidase [Deltaproteobacteria bacterium]
MPAIYIDLDDVIADTTCRYVEILEREFGRIVDFEGITTFDLKKSFSLTDHEFDYFFRLVHEPEIILELKPFEGVLDELNKWAGLGYEISVVTGRLTSTYESSLEWLRRNKVPFDSFIMVDKYLRPVVDKNIAISLDRFSEMEFILAVEDSLDMSMFLQHRMNTKVILFDRPWNRDSGNLAGIRRCMTWDEIGMLDQFSGILDSK